MDMMRKAVDGRFLRRLRYASFALFVAALLAGSSTIIKADGLDCVMLEPSYYGFIYEGETWCAEQQNYCDTFCWWCFQMVCAYVNNCTEGGISGACSY
jgi:hypothetical protein